MLAVSGIKCINAIARKTPPLKVFAKPSHFSLFLQALHFIGTKPARKVITKQTKINTTLITNILV
jgi:hypothetical protein